jgi:hypothetical protein
MELASAYRAVAQSHGQAVQMMRYDLPTEDAVAALPPQIKPPPPAQQRPPHDTPTTETKVPPTVWVRDFLLFATNPAKLLLVRKELDPKRTEEYAIQETLGLLLTFTGAGSHVRFWGEAGLHDIRVQENQEGVNPDVLVYASTETLKDYRPPEAVIRRGFLKDRDIRREYDIGKGTMRDFVLDRTWSGLHGSLHNWLEPAVAANMRLRLLRLIVE